MPDIEQQVTFLTEKAKRIRTLIVQMLGKAGSGHPGGSLSSADLLTALYFGVMRHDPKRPLDPDADIFHMSKGHCCPLWYAVLAESGYFPLEQLWTLRKLGSCLQGHPDRRTCGVRSASGSLGQGLSVALGMSLACKLDKRQSRVYVLLGDGEIQEGNVWEAAMASAHYAADNLCAMLDYNGFQIDGRTNAVMNLEPVADKWRSFGWQVIAISGHDMRQILDAFAEAKRTTGRPSIIIASTVKGKGVSFMENVVDFHGRAPSKDETGKAVDELNSPP